MDTMKITKQLKDLIETNQNQLKAGIRNHQRLLAILESDPENTDVQKQLQTEQEHIIVIGLEQKVILDKLRKEYKVFRKQTKINGTKNSIDDKRFNLTIALHRAKKQTIIQRSTASNPSLVTSSTPLPLSAPTNHSSTRHQPQRQRHQPSPPSPPEDYDSSSNNAPLLPSAAVTNHNVYGPLGNHMSSSHSSPEPTPLFPGGSGGLEEEEQTATGKRPLFPDELGQVEFLQYLHLATHEVFKEMQSKRVERKRRSTANPQFLYTRGWDISKRKRNFYLSNLTSSPPTTRQSAQRNSKVAKLALQQQQQNDQQRISPPAAVAAASAHSNTVRVEGATNRSGSASPVTDEIGGAPTANLAVSLPGITHLPSGLTIEPVREEQTICIDCKQPGNLSICEECSHAFHVACHNRPLVATPKHCPVCYTDAKEARLRQQQQMALSQASSPITINVPSTSVALSPHQQQQVLLFEEKLQLKNTLLTRNKLLTNQLTELQDQHSKLTISLRAQQQEKEDLITNQDHTKSKIQHIMTFVTAIKGSDDGTTTEKHEEPNELTTDDGLEVVLIEETMETELKNEEKSEDLLEIDKETKGIVIENVNVPILSKFVGGNNGSRPKVVVIQQSPT